jgi:hypothetical protein
MDLRTIFNIIDSAVCTQRTDISKLVKQDPAKRYPPEDDQLNGSKHVVEGKKNDTKIKELHNRRCQKVILILS